MFLRLRKGRYEWIKMRRFIGEFLAVKQGSYNAQPDSHSVGGLIENANLVRNRVTRVVVSGL
jgi:hypothetical protein